MLFRLVPWNTPYCLANDILKYLILLLRWVMQLMMRLRLLASQINPGQLILFVELQLATDTIGDCVKN